MVALTSGPICEMKCGTKFSLTCAEWLRARWWDVFWLAPSKYAPVWRAEAAFVSAR